MRVDEKPGYRVYYAIADQQVILLLLQRRQDDPESRYRTSHQLLERLEEEAKKMTRQKRNSQAHDEVVADMLREDPAFRVALIQEVLSNGEQADMLTAMQLRLA